MVICFNPRAHAGRDIYFRIFNPNAVSFNPRAHAGRDAVYAPMKASFAKVSIHAPTRGATRIVFSITGLFDCFNPRAHAGRDVNWAVLKMIFMFQSTRPRGARLAMITSFSPDSSFNPRAHAGRDEPFVSTFSVSCVSIHAPTRGATPFEKSL